MHYIVYKLRYRSHFIYHRLSSSDAPLKAASLIDQVSGRVTALRLSSCNFKPGHTKERNRYQIQRRAVLGNGLERGGVELTMALFTATRPAWPRLATLLCLYWPLHTS